MPQYVGYDKKPTKKQPKEKAGKITSPVKTPKKGKK